jgi:GDPmannose 4,6-dehydratase
MPTALVTGVSGQDGSYLAELLTGKGYRVVGTTRNRAAALTLPYASAFTGVDLVEVALDSRNAVGELLARHQPDEVYHLAGPSRVGASWQDPAGTLLGVVMPTMLLLEAVLAESPSARCFFAGSCDMFAAEEHAQDESAPREPTSPYGRAKREAEEIVRRYREQHSLHAASGILFNHESPRRDGSFVSRKIARAAARIARGLDQTLSLGTVQIRRDWGFSGDYVRAMWLMLQQREPEDLVIGTGVAHSIADFYELAFRRVGLNGRDFVVEDPALVRPGDAPLRLANPARARALLGWTPEVDFERLVAMMVDSEIADVGRRMSEPGDTRFE